MAGKEKPLGRIVRGLVNREEHTIFDSWIFDNRPGGLGDGGGVNTLNKQRRFFQGGNDPRRTNHFWPGCFPSDETFRITHMGAHISFSDDRCYPAFMREAIATLSVGDRPAFVFPMTLLAQAKPIVEHLEGSALEDTGIRYWHPIERPIAIPPRQGFELVHMTGGGRFAQLIHEVGADEHGFAMIRYMMKGIHTRPVFEDELTDEQKAKLARDHEEGCRLMREEAEAAARRHDEDQKLFDEEMAWMINILSGADVKPVHVRAALNARTAIENAVFTIGGHGYPGGVPGMMRPMEFGVLDPVEAGAILRDPDAHETRDIDIDRVKLSATRIAHRRIECGLRLDDSYIMEVAADCGIKDFKLAAPGGAEYTDPSYTIFDDE